MGQGTWKAHKKTFQHQDIWKTQMVLQVQERYDSIYIYIYQGTVGSTPNSVPMVFIVFFRDSWGLKPINTHYIRLI